MSDTIAKVAVPAGGVESKRPTVQDLLANMDKKQRPADKTDAGECPGIFDIEFEFAAGVAKQHRRGGLRIFSGHTSSADE